MQVVDEFKLSVLSMPAHVVDEFKLSVLSMPAHVYMYYDNR